MAQSKTQVTTGKVRLSYLNVFEPKSINGSKPKYSVSLIISKSDKLTLDRVNAAIQAALEEGKSSKFGGKVPPTYKHPLRDGDVERPEDPAYKNSYFVNANSDNKPGVVGPNLEAILDKDEFWSGCYGRASVNFYAFNTNGNKGIACGLNHVQKLSDGERLDSRIAVDQAFAEEFDDIL